MHDCASFIIICANSDRLEVLVVSIAEGIWGLVSLVNINWCMPIPSYVVPVPNFFIIHYALHVCSLLWGCVQLFIWESYSYFLLEFSMNNIFWYCENWGYKSQEWTTFYFDAWPLPHRQNATSTKDGSRVTSVCCMNEYDHDNVLKWDKNQTDSKVLRMKKSSCVKFTLHASWIWFVSVVQSPNGC